MGWDGALYLQLLGNSVELLWVIVPAVLFGIVIGALPGFSASNTLIILLPLTLTMDLDVALAFMASDHLGPNLPRNGTLLTPGHSFGLGFCVRTDEGMASVTSSAGQFFWSGIAGTFFWIDPKEDLFAVFMSQGPGQREYFRNVIRNLVYAAVE